MLSLSVVTLALYITLVMRQLLSSGHWSFFLQLHPLCDVKLLFKMFLLWFLMMLHAHVRHATVAYFHVVLVEAGVEIMVWWEVFLD